MCGLAGKIIACRKTESCSVATSAVELSLLTDQSGNMATEVGQAKLLGPTTNSRRPSDTPGQLTGLRLLWPEHRDSLELVLSPVETSLRYLAN